VIVDALVYAGASLYGGGRTLAGLLGDADAAGVDRLVAAPAKPLDYDLAGASLRLAAECAASGGRAVCLARLDPWQPDAAERLALLLEHPAVRGLLLHPWEETFPANHERARALAVQAAAAGRPVVVEAGHPLLAEALSLADLARRVEGTVVMTRGGQVNMAGLAQQSADLALAAAPNLCALSAGMYRQDWLEGCVARFGAARLLHGSCAPVFDLGYEAERVRRAAMGAGERAAVMGGNAMMLFGWATGEQG
jgi:predicted TIM-barrel fold metal-dependent hydrolase